MKMFQPGVIKPEEHYEKLSRLATLVGLPVPMVHLGISCRDANGTATTDYRTRSRTYNRNFWNIMLANMINQPTVTTDFGAGYLSVKNNLEALLEVTPPLSFIVEGPDDTARGIVVGTGTAAESYEGFELDTIVEHGTSTGQLSYQAQTDTAVAYTAGTKVWTITMVRVIDNLSGAPILVTETGIYTLATNTPANVMIMRDLVGTPIPVANNGDVTVTYTFTLTFPA
jgi:hypothetical protein